MTDAVIVEGDLELVTGEGGIFGITMAEEIFEVETVGGVSAVGDVPDDTAEEMSGGRLVGEAEASGVIMEELNGDDIGIVVVNEVSVVFGDDGLVRVLAEGGGTPRKVKRGIAVGRCGGVVKLGIGEF